MTVTAHLVSGKLVQNIFVQGKVVSRTFVRLSLVWKAYSFGSHLSGRLIL